MAESHDKAVISISISRNYFASVSYNLSKKIEHSVSDPAILGGI
jgi:hypothetical protein